MEEDQKAYLFKAGRVKLCRLECMLKFSLKLGGLMETTIGAETVWRRLDLPSSLHTIHHTANRNRVTSASVAS